MACLDHSVLNPVIHSRLALLSVCFALLVGQFAYFALICGALQASLARLCLDYLLSRPFYEGDFEIGLAIPKIIMISIYEKILL